MLHKAFLGDTLDFKFCTVAPSTGAPATLSGTPVVSAYLDNDVTQLTAGITLSADFDSVTGLNNVRVVATAANGYDYGEKYYLIITTGTVDSVSAVGYVVGEFYLYPSVCPELSVIDYGTAQAATGTTLQLRSALAFADDELNGATLYITGGTTGVGQRKIITAYTSSTDTATVDTWVTTPTGTITYIVYASPPAPATITASLSGTVGGIAGTITTLDALDTAQDSQHSATQSRLPAALTNGAIDANITRINDAAVTGDGSATPWDAA